MTSQIIAIGIILISLVGLTYQPKPAPERVRKHR